MFLHYLRENKVVSVILTAFRLYLGWSWFYAGWGKISSGNFDASGFLKSALGKVSGDHPSVQPWWGDFIQNVALPRVEFFNLIVPWGELLVGLALIFGIFTSFAALMGLMMNFAYLFSGTTSTNPQMVLLGVIILVAGLNAGKIGLDRWTIPYINNNIFKQGKIKDTPEAANL